MVTVLPRVGVFEVENGSTAADFGFQSGDVLLRIDDEEVFAVSDVDDWTLYDAAEFEVLRNGNVEHLQVSLDTLDKENRAVVSYVFPGLPADEAGLQQGDLIIGLQGVSVHVAEDVYGITTSSESDVLEYIVKRDGRTVSFDIPKGEDGLVGIYVDNIDYSDGFGLDIYDTSVVVTVTDIEPVKYGLLEAPVESVKELSRLAVLTVGMVKGLATDLISSGQVSDGVAGPVGIAQMTHVFVQEGFAAVIRFIALLSLSLGVFNILPFPALDGGRLVFLMFEAVTGKKPNERLESSLHGLGFILLMLLLVAVTYKDIVGLVVGG